MLSRWDFCDDTERGLELLAYYSRTAANIVIILLVDIDLPYDDCLVLIAIGSCPLKGLLGPQSPYVCHLVLS